MTDITLSAEEYMELLESKQLLDALHRDGVNHWAYYDDTVRELKRVKDAEIRRENDIENLIVSVLGELSLMVEYPAGIDAGAGFPAAAYDLLEEFYDQRYDIGQRDYLVE